MLLLMGFHYSPVYFHHYLILIIPNRQLTTNDSQLTSASLPSCCIVTTIASSSSFNVFIDFIEASQWLRNTITRTLLSSSTTTSRYPPIGKLIIRVNNECILLMVLYFAETPSFVLSYLHYFGNIVPHIDGIIFC